MIIRNINEMAMKPVEMPGVQGAEMAVMVGRQDGAPNFALRQFRVAAGGFTPRHAHDYEHEVFIVEGSGTVLLGGEERAVKAGDVIYVPANHEHQFKAGASNGSGAAGLRFLCLVPMTRDCGEPTPGSG